MKKVMLSAAVCAMAFTANADVAEEVEVIEAAQTSAFSSIYTGLGIGGSFFESSEAKIAAEKKRLKANRFIGSFVLGAGKVFSNNVYVGGEFLMDFTKNKKTEWKDDAGRLEGKVGGYIPQVNFRAGYVFKNDVLAYAKLGCAWTKASVKLFAREDGGDWVEVPDNIAGTMSKTKASFVLGLGAEKAFCKKFSAAVEADYNFGWKQKIFKENFEQSVRFNKGWTVRALVKYNVKY